MTAIRLRAHGELLGIVLPPEIVERLNLRLGDTLYAVDTADGVLLTTKDPEFERQMEVARRLMKKSRNILRALARS